MNYLLNLILATSIPGLFCREIIHNWIHESIEKYAVNFRTLNGTHKFGSSSPVDGAFGVIQVISNQSDVEWLITKAEAGPYVAVLNPHTFTSSVMTELLKSGKISGVVIVSDDSTPPDNYSFDSTCPNYNSESPTCNVNPFGNSFMLTDWPVPLTLVDQPAGVNAIIDCYKKFNLPLDDSQLSHPLCSLHMKNRMFAAVNSEVCMRRNNYFIHTGSVKNCDPLGGQSIILPLGNFGNESKGVIMITARLDVGSIFDGIAPGAMSSVTAITTLLTTAHIFTTLLNNTDIQDYGVLFMLLNGEAYDYIGSSKVVYDLQRGSFLPGYNLELKSVLMVIDVSQINNNAPLFIHSKNSGGGLSQKFIPTFTKYGKSLDVRDITLKPFIPTSVTSFLKASPDKPVFMISNYQDQFENRYYHGLFDTSENIKYVFKNGSSIEPASIQNHISEVSKALSMSMYEVITGKTSPELGSFSNLTDELLHCYLQNNLCKYMKASLPKDHAVKKGPESLYVGVVRGTNAIAKMTGRLMAFLTSPNVSLPAENCTNLGSSKLYMYIWMNGLSGEGICVNTTFQFVTAISPAFEIPDYNWTSSEYSTWTESSWLDLDLYMFLKPPPAQEYITFFSGISVLLLSFIVVYFLSRKDFRHSTPESIPSF